jgi:hypothetical protein
VSAVAHPDRGVLRWARLGAFTLPAVGFAVLMHAAAQGCVSVQGVLESGLSCVAAGGMLLQGEQGRARIVGWLISCQALTHVLLQIHCPESRAAALGVDTRMLLAHGCAAVIAVAFLAPAERAVWAAARIAPAVRRAAAACLRPPTPALVPKTSTGRLIASVPVALPVFTRACPPPARRGPPAVAALA